jgi:hypothetical protein
VCYIFFFVDGLSVGCFNFFKALEKKFEILSWVGFASSFKNFGRVVACAVFKCACKLGG